MPSGKGAGRQPLDPFAVLKQGWQLTVKSLGSYVPALLLAFIIVFVLNSVMTNVLQQYLPDAPPEEIMLRVMQILSILIAPLEAGLIMMGVEHARGHRTRPLAIFGQFRRSALVIITSLLMTFFSQLGLYLYLLPGIFLLVALSMTMPLVIERKLSPLQAMWLSVTTTTGQWFKLFTLYTICVLLIIAGAMAFGVGVLIALPFFLNVKGLLYLHLFEAADGEAQPDDSNEHDQFEA